MSLKVRFVSLLASLAPIRNTNPIYTNLMHNEYPYASPKACAC